MFIIVQISLRLQGWKAKFLSFGGCNTLIRSVLLSLPVHTMSCLVIPKSVIHRVEGMIKSFLWSQQGERRAHWVSWKNICTPTCHGGLGIRSLSDTIFGMQGKLAGTSLWARIMQQKYGINRCHVPITLHQTDSRLWRKLMQHFQSLLAVATWQIGRIGLERRLIRRINQH